MTTAHRHTLRRAGRELARMGAVISAVMLLLTAIGTLVGSPSASAAATNGGDATVIVPLDAAANAGSVLTSGGSATPFSLRLPNGAACTGDSANDGYRVQTYMVLGTVDVATLQFGGAGPNPTAIGASFRQPLFTTTSNGYVDAQTANASNPGGPGPVVAIPAFALGAPDVFVPGNIPAGTYNIGIACTKGPASATQLDKFWNARLTVVTSAGDQPAGVTWTAAAPTTTTTSGGGGTTSTTAAGGTTSTTRPGSTTSTTATGGSTTSTTSASGATTTTVSGGSPSGTSGSVGSLPLTGSSPMATFVWAIVLLACGRMAVLLGRPPRVRPAK